MIKAASLIFAVLISLPVFSQSKIEVSYDKTVMLVFEHPINPTGSNCGQKELVGISISGNKLVLQAKEEYFEETNLIVELTDGSLYAFDLVYNNTPKNTFHIIKATEASYIPKVNDRLDNNQSESLVSSPPKQNNSNSSIDKKNKGNSAVSNTENKIKDRDVPIKKATSAQSSLEVGDLVGTCDKIIQTPDYLKRIGVISKKMFLYVGGIYVSSDKLYFKVNVKNVSSVPFDVDYSQFLVKTFKSGLSRNASPQANKITPLYIKEPEVVTVNQNETKTWVYVFEKFTIDEDKRLFIEFWEKNGDRNLEIPIESIEILNAKNNL